MKSDHPFLRLLPTIGNCLTGVVDRVVMLYLVASVWSGWRLAAFVTVQAAIVIALGYANIRYGPRLRAKLAELGAADDADDEGPHASCAH